MLGGILRRLFGGSPQVATLLPETLELQPGREVRVVMPKIEGGYAAIANSSQGLFIFNHYDLGVGWQLRTLNAYDVEQMNILSHMARAAPADPVILDIGANIGVTSVLFGRLAGPRGQVHAYEPQRVMFHMLAGNIALNSIDNTHCHWLAVGAAPGSAKIPRLDYRREAGFGSIELNRETQSDAAQQAVGGQLDEVPMVSVDSLNLPRVDLIKIDVEGMEADVLEGAMQTLRAHHPLIYLEYIKSDQAALWRTLSAEGYLLYDTRENFVCVPAGHPASVALAADMQPWRPAA